jgi:hypothetical protein
MREASTACGWRKSIMWICERAKEIVGGGAGKHHGKTLRNQPLLDIKMGVRSISNHQKTLVFMWVAGGIQGRLSAYSSIGERYNLECNSPSAPKVARSPLTSSQNLDFTKAVEFG